jgi:hypothetical protein
MPGRTASRFSFAALLVTFTFTLAAQAPLVPARSLWKYLDSGTDPGTAWRGLSFDDSTWSSGPAKLGYGQGDESTIVGYGPDPSQRHITTYFRQSFEVADPLALSTLRLRLIRDDGAVVYLNGTEVWRSNMPSGTVTYRTAAASTVSDADEVRWFESTTAASVLRRGTNVVAVEVHQVSAGSSDLAFALEILADGATATPNLLRGPYLQQATPTSMIVQWRTDAPSDSRVRYGTSPSSLTNVVDDASATTEHVVRITDLTPATKYYYAVETTLARVGGGTAEDYFVTSPPAGSAAATRVWVLGDAGTGTSDAAAVRDAYYATGGRASTDLLLLLGDNAYEDGLDSDYQRNFFEMYQGLLRNTPVWPALGNHDTAQSTNPPPTIPYFTIFTLPTGGEAGGEPSETEKYYSFDYGNIHFICLDSMTSDRSPGGPMLTWLRDDLAATRQPWIVAFWHHPPYSKGTHDSDLEIELLEMRRHALPILEEGGVDLVLTGHSHTYERSYLINGHYGHSSTFTSSMKLDGGSGSGEAAYRKGTTATSSWAGTVYVVSGTAGYAGSGPLDHPAMTVSRTDLGSTVLTVDGLRMRVTFLLANGTTGDSFTIDKSGVPPAPRRRRVRSG